MCPQNTEKSLKMTGCNENKWNIYTNLLPKNKETLFNIRSNTYGGTPTIKYCGLFWFNLKKEEKKTEIFRFLNVLCWFFGSNLPLVPSSLRQDNTDDVTLTSLGLYFRALKISSLTDQQLFWESTFESIFVHKKISISQSHLYICESYLIET